MEDRDSSWVALLTVASEQEAFFIQGMLEAEGIPCTLESLKYHAEPVNLGRLSEIRIHVLEQDRARAKGLLDTAAQQDPSHGDHREDH
jgi:hypothetical protein